MDLAEKRVRHVRSDDGCRDSLTSLDGFAYQFNLCFLSNETVFLFNTDLIWIEFVCAKFEMSKTG